jgi:hypothetical protein
MNSFRYPEREDLLLDREYVGDFLRDPTDFPDRVDFNYLRNQRDAANYFLDWFQNVDERSYSEMLSRCHQIAAVGSSGTSVYAIRWKTYLLIPSVGNSGIVHFETTDRDALRETHPGVFRSELAEAGIPHPAMDLFELSFEEFTILSALGDDSFGSGLDWNRDAGRSLRSAGSTGIYQIHVHGTEIKLEVFITESGDLERRNPIGQTYEQMRELCDGQMSRIRRRWGNESPDMIVDSIFHYYHAAINWMPFSNINNSILMAQMNSLRRCLGATPLPHGNLDTFALLTTSDGFLRLFQ